MTAIRGFEPSPGHLRYPQNLFVPPGPSFPFSIASTEVTEASAAAQPMQPVQLARDDVAIYPPLLRLVDCLSVVSDAVSAPAFQALSQHAVEGCLAGFFDAADRIVASPTVRGWLHI